MNKEIRMIKSIEVIKSTTTKQQQKHQLKQTK